MLAPPPPAWIDRAGDKLAEACAELAATGVGCEALVLDLADVVNVVAQVTAAVARLGHVDILVNAAGATQPFGRLLSPEDPAGMIAFLTSDAAVMTGTIIDLDQFVAGTVDDNPGR